MTDAFIAFVRHEQELLLLRRSSSDPDAAEMWEVSTESETLRKMSSTVSQSAQEFQWKI